MAKILTQEEFDRLDTLLHTGVSHFSLISQMINKNRIIYDELLSYGEQCVPYIINKYFKHEYTDPLILSLLLELKPELGNLIIICDTDVESIILNWYNYTYHNIPYPDSITVGNNYEMKFDMRLVYNNIIYTGCAYISENQHISFELYINGDKNNKADYSIYSYARKQLEATKEYKLFSKRLEYQMMYEPKTFLINNRNQEVMLIEKKDDTIVFYNTKKDVVVEFKIDSLQQLIYQYEKNYTYHPNLLEKINENKL